MGEVISFDLVGRNHDLLRDVFLAQRLDDVLVAHLLAELLDGHALCLQRFDERDAVAETFADAILHDLIHHVFRQLVAVHIKRAEDQLAFDQLLQAVAERVVQFLLKNIRCVGILPAQRIGGRRGEFLHLRIGDHRIAHDRLDAVGQFRVQRPACQQNTSANIEMNRKNFIESV